MGFFAMGDLDNTGFETTLPDGEYCDIIHDCKQTVTVENGYLHVTAYKPEDAMVALCVGCQ